MHPVIDSQSNRKALVRLFPTATIFGRRLSKHSYSAEIAAYGRIGLRDRIMLEKRIGVVGIKVRT